MMYGFQILCSIVAMFLFVEVLGAQEWRQEAALSGSSIVAMHRHKGLLYASTSERGVVFTSPDSGRIWQRTTITEPLFSPGKIASTPDFVFVGGYGGGLWRTSDSGRTWQQVAGMFLNLPVADVVSFGTDVWIAAGSSVFRGRANGTLWEERRDGLPADVTPVALFTSPNNIFVGTRGSGVFRWNESARRWEAINTGLFDARITALHEHNGQLFAGTAGSGVFRYSPQDNRWLNISVGLPPAQPILFFAAGAGELFVGLNGGVFRLLTISWQILTQQPYTPLSTPTSALVLNNELLTGTQSRGFWRIQFTTVSIGENSAENDDVCPCLFRSGMLICSLPDSIAEASIKIIDLNGRMHDEFTLTQPTTAFRLPPSLPRVFFVVYSSKKAVLVKKMTFF